MQLSLAVVEKFRSSGEKAAAIGTSNGPFGRVAFQMVFEFEGGGPFERALCPFTEDFSFVVSLSGFVTEGQFTWPVNKRFS